MWRQPDRARRNADGQDRDVVVESITEAGEQVGERLHNVVCSRRCEISDELLQLVLVVPAALRIDAGLGKPVGVKQQRVFGIEANFGSGEVGVGNDPDELALVQGQKCAAPPARRTNAGVCPPVASVRAAPCARGSSRPINTVQNSGFSSGRFWINTRLSAVKT
jgi:hypothetical protein